MTRDEWFIISLPVAYTLGYLCGRLALPKMLRFPFRAHMVGRSMFLVLTIFLAFRATWTYFFAHHFFDPWLIVSSYVDVIAISIGVTFGYDSFSLQSPDSLQSAISAMRDDEIFLKDPFERSKR